MRSDAMKPLGALVGEWTATMKNAWFLDPDLEPTGHVAVEWLHDAFVVFRWTMTDDVGAATGDMVLVLGRSDANDAYTALYHDERGVCRVFAMTLAGTRWTLTREDPDMFQRFIGEIHTDKIDGRWEASEDEGQTWRKDFDLVLARK